MYVIPLTTAPNQTFNCTIPIDGSNRPLSFQLRYNSIAKYWNLTVIDARTKDTLIDAVPLMVGEHPAANLLEQFEYMGIGSAVVVHEGDLPSHLNPDDTNLGSEYYLVWGDTV
jgi:hypothetical protein